jgi:hypothetical protein
MRLRSLPILAVACHLLSAGTQAQEEPRFLLSPPPGDGPVVVQVGFFLSDVNRIDIEQQQFEVEGVLTLTWQDDRLAFDPEVVGVEEKVYQGNYQFSEIATGWWPQLVLANESGGYERQGLVLRNRFDGRMTYVEELNAVAEMPVELRRFPFDREQFELVFEVLGFDKDQVMLVVDSSTTGVPAKGISLAEWQLEGVHAASGDHDPAYADGRQEMKSAVVIALELARQPGFMLRVVVFPMVLLVMLSWSVFWMDRESLGERMDISFIGILTVVAYQIMVSSTIPRIPYFTLMSAFIYISFVTMCGSVVINLVVGRMDRTGRRELGDRIDRRCRWVFPTAYVTLLVLAAGYFFVRY